jgi:hypothetical protein
VLPSKIYLELARVAHFNVEDQAQAREFDSNLLEERCNAALANVRKYQESLKRYYNKSRPERAQHWGLSIEERHPHKKTSTSSHHPEKDRSS